MVLLQVLDLGLQEANVANQFLYLARLSLPWDMSAPWRRHVSVLRVGSYHTSLLITKVRFCSYNHEFTWCPSQ
jgi:hypothetical protein